MTLRPSYWIIIAICLSVVGFIAWAQWAELDQVTRAPGKLVPFDRIQVVQSEEGGAISKIYVREGDEVKAGELLVELDTVQLTAGAAEISARVAALRSRMARIDAELFNKPLAFLPAWPISPNSHRTSVSFFRVGKRRSLRNCADCNQWSICSSRS